MKIPIPKSLNILKYLLFTKMVSRYFPVNNNEDVERKIKMEEKGSGSFHFLVYTGESIFSKFAK